MFEQCIYFNLSALDRQVTKIWQAEFSAVGLSASHGYLLAAMAANPAASQKELSSLMELDASTITRFVDALAAKRLIEKTSTGKGATFALTEQGMEACERIERSMKDLFDRMRDALGKRNFNDFVKQIRNTRQSLKEQAI